MERDFVEFIKWMSDERQKNYYAVVVRYPVLKENMCHAHCDGECYWEHCPQFKDGEPTKSGRHCPLPHWSDNPEY
jgi:hypothetical protein